MNTRFRAQRRPVNLIPSAASSKAAAGHPSTYSSATASPLVGPAKRPAPPPSETLTVCLNSDTPRGVDDGEDVEDIPVIAGLSAVAEAEQDPEPLPDPLARPVSDQVPSVVAVYAEGKQSRHVQQLMQKSSFFRQPSEQSHFFESSLWRKVSRMIVDNSIRYTSQHKNDIAEKMSMRFEAKKKQIFKNYVVNYKIFEEEDNNDWLFECQAILYLMVIGVEYMKPFQRLVSPVWGEDKIPIVNQIKQVVREAIELKVYSFFDVRVAQHVYCIVGFFCDAGGKEADRRTDKNNIRACIRSMLNNAISREEKDVAAIKKEPPHALTDPVDQRCNMGGAEISQPGDVHGICSDREGLLLADLHPQLYDFWRHTHGEGLPGHDGEPNNYLSLLGLV